MLFNDLKMPILVGVNDIPSTDLDSSHPNGSLICDKFNTLIDRLDVPPNITDSFYILTLDVNEVEPNNTTLFNDPVKLLSHINNSSLFFAYEGTITINLLSNCTFGSTHIAPHLKMTDTLIAAIKIQGSGGVRTITVPNLVSPYKIEFSDVIIDFISAKNTHIAFGSSVTLNGTLNAFGLSFYFTNCYVQMYGTFVLGSMGSSGINLFNTVWESNSATSLNFYEVYNSSIYINKFGDTNPATTVIPKFSIQFGSKCSVYIKPVTIQYLLIAASNSEVSIENCIITFNNSVDPDKSLDLVLTNSNLHISGTTITDNLTSKIILAGGKLSYYKSIFTSNNLTNIHLESKAAIIISEKDAGNAVNTAIAKFGTLPTLANAVIFEDGVLLGR